MNKSQRERFQSCVEWARAIVNAARAQAPDGCDPQNSWVAVGVGVATVAVSAYSAYSTNKNQQAGLEQAGMQPAIVPANFENPSAAYGDYASLAQTELPSLRAVATDENRFNNKQFQDTLAANSPMLLHDIRRQGQNANMEQRVARQYLTGRIPRDVVNQVSRSSAFQALSGGYAGSDAAHANEARNLGLTSIDLQGKGFAGQAQANSTVGANLANASALSPYQTTGDALLLTPQQLLARSDNTEAYSNAVLNRNNQIQFGNQSYLGAANSYSPGTSAAISGIGSLAGQYASKSGVFTGFGNNASGSGAYNQVGSDAYDANSAAAQDQYGYNSYLDSNNYDSSGSFVGNPYSYGG